MKTKYGEYIRFNYNDDPKERVIWGSFDKLYPLPSQYQEVPYIQTNAKNNGSKTLAGRIILDDFKITDVDVGDTLRVDFRMAHFTDATNFTWFGLGHFPQTSGSGTYDFSLWTYQVKVDDVTYYPFTLWAGTVIRDVDTTYNKYNYGEIYHIEMWQKHHVNVNNAVYRISGAKITEESTGTVFMDVDNHSVNTGAAVQYQYDIPFAIFDIAMYETANEPYCGWPASNHTTTSQNAKSSTYSSKDGVFYSRGKIFINNDIYMYLYTCYNKTTHQYGIYDAVKGHFYTDNIENIDGYFTNNPNYYYDNIATVTGTTRIAKEKKFLNICGPND